MMIAIRRLLAPFLLVLSTSANAQIPVTDVASIVENVTHYAETVRQWKKEYDQWKQDYEAITGDWGALVAGELGLDQMREYRDTFPDELEEYLADDSSITGALSGDYTYFKDLVSKLPAGTLKPGSDLEKAHTAYVTAVAKKQATADNVYRSSQANLSTADRLRDKVQTATTIKNATDLNARINSELLSAQAEANRLTAIQIRQAADADRAAMQSAEELYKATINRPPAVTY